MATSEENAPPLSLWARLSYGLGDFASGLVWNFAGAFLLYFYTDVALLPVAAIGGLFLISRLLDAGFDPVVGLLVDRTKSRWGKARPYLLFFALPYAILSALTFWSPPVAISLKIVWAYSTFMALGLVMSLIGIPYSALLPLMTPSPHQRMQLGSIRAGMTALSVILVTLLTMTLVKAFGGADPATGFVRVAGLYGLIAGALILNLFWVSRERTEETIAQPSAFSFSSIKDMLRNRAWLVVSGFAALNFIRFGAVLSVTPYFAIQVLKKPWMMAFLMPAISGTLVVGAAVAPAYFRRFGLKRGNLLAFLAFLIAFAPLFFLEGSPALFIGFYVTSSLALSLTMTSIFSMAADTVDYHESRFGERCEGLLSSGVSLATKVGMALGTAFVAYGLAAGSYVAGHVGPGAILAIRILYYGASLATVAAQALTITLLPDLAARFSPARR